MGTSAGGGNSEPHVAAAFPIIDPSFEMPPLTPWSSSSSLVSDRIRPPTPSKQQQQNKGSKGKGKGPATPKSRTVRVLEARLDGARGSNGRTKDPKGGCFCQGKLHPVALLLIHLPIDLAMHTLLLLLTVSTYQLETTRSRIMSRCADTAD